MGWVCCQHVVGVDNEGGLGTSSMSWHGEHDDGLGTSSTCSESRHRRVEVFIMPHVFPAESGHSAGILRIPQD